MVARMYLRGLSFDLLIEHVGGLEKSLLDGSRYKKLSSDTAMSQDQLWHRTADPKK
jgi:hypothetical protein